MMTAEHCRLPSESHCWWHVLHATGRGSYFYGGKKAA